MHCNFLFKALVRIKASVFYQCYITGRCTFQLNTIIMTKGVNILDVLMRFKPFRHVTQARYLHIVFADKIKLCAVLVHDIVELLIQPYTTQHQNNVTDI